jgi:pimeloyl-ACP methyl ester carboxylesterase
VSGAVPVVLVHGNPETAAVWDPLAAALRERGVPEVVRLSPPGFGAPVPADWGATMPEYRQWLADELGALGRPVHLVGHDWGGIHVLGVAMTRPDLLVSWSSDALGLLDPGYTWHDLARTWQTPGEGEAAVAAMTRGAVAERAAHLESMRVPAGIAAQLAPGCTPLLGDCVLRLYRSAAPPALAELGRGLPTAAARPGLALLADADGAVGTPEQRRRSAALAGAEVAVLDAAGHWWMHDAPGPAADALTGFWSAAG